MLALVFVLAQVAIPPARGYVNDFAAVLDSASIRHMEQVITEVRNATRGEIAVVTLPDIGDRPASDVAVKIGRQWGVGAQAEAGDPAKNLGVVVLLVPRKNHRPGTGDVFIATGQCAEGFLTDASAGRIREAMLPALGTEEYGKALALGVDLIAQAFAAELGVTLTNPEYVRPPPVDNRPQIPVGWIIAVAILLLYGSGAMEHRAGTGEPDALNTLLIVDSVDADLFTRLAKPVREWMSAKHPPPLVLTDQEWRDSADAFPIEYEDIRAQHRMLAGRDPWRGITVQRAHVRRQLEQELMGKLMHLRQACAAYWNTPKQLAAVVRETQSSFLTMLRAVLRLAGHSVPAPPDALVRDAAAPI